MLEYVLSYKWTPKSFYAGGIYELVLNSLTEHHASSSIKSIWHMFRVNPYPLHFGYIQERHLWKKNPKFTFQSLMTSYMTDIL